MRDPANAQEAQDLKVFIQLGRIEKAKSQLTKNEAKRFNRARVRLVKAGVVNPITRAQLEAAVRSTLTAMPFYRRWWLKIQFHYREWRLRRKESQDG